MFAVKMAEMINLKKQWETHKRLLTEYDNVIAELEAVTNASPQELAEEVQKIITKTGRRRSSLTAAGPLSSLSGAARGRQHSHLFPAVPNEVYEQADPSFDSQELFCMPAPLAFAAAPILPFCSAGKGGHIQCRCRWSCE